MTFVLCCNYLKTEEGYVYAAFYVNVEIKASAPMC